MVYDIHGEAYEAEISAADETKVRRMPSAVATEARRFAGVREFQIARLPHMNVDEFMRIVGEFRFKRALKPCVIETITKNRMSMDQRMLLVEKLGERPAKEKGTRKFKDAFEPFLAAHEALPDDAKRADGRVLPMKDFIRIVNDVKQRNMKSVKNLIFECASRMTSDMMCYLWQRVENMDRAYRDFHNLLCEERSMDNDIMTLDRELELATEIANEVLDREVERMKDNAYKAYFVPLDCPESLMKALIARGDGHIAAFAVRMYRTLFRGRRRLHEFRVGERISKNEVTMNHDLLLRDALDTLTMSWMRCLEPIPNSSGGKKQQRWTSTRVHVSDVDLDVLRSALAATDDAMVTTIAAANNKRVKALKKTPTSMLFRKSIDVTYGPDLRRVHVPAGRILFDASDRSMSFVRNLDVLDGKYKHRIELVRVGADGSVSLANVDKVMEREAVAAMTAIQKAMVDGLYEDLMQKCSSVMMHCVNCGKELTDPKSIEVGMGETCVRKNARIQAQVAASAAAAAAAADENITAADVQAMNKYTDDVVENCKKKTYADAVGAGSKDLLDAALAALAEKGGDDGMIAVLTEMLESDVPTIVDTLSRRLLDGLGHEATALAIVDLHNAVHRGRIYGPDEGRVNNAMLLSHRLGFQVQALHDFVTVMGAAVRLPACVSDAYCEIDASGGGDDAEGEGGDDDDAEGEGGDDDADDR